MKNLNLDLGMRRKNDRETKPHGFGGVFPKKPGALSTSFGTNFQKAV